MAIISSFTLIRAISLFHITAAYCFLTSPRMIADQNIVFMLGESMRLPHATTIEKPTETSAFLAVILAFLGISDLVAASLNEETGLQYWLAAVPSRITFLFAITGYVYLFKEDGLFGSGFGAKAGIGEPLQNSMVFSFGFFEIAAWFWVFTKLREERGQLVMRMAERVKAEQDRL